MTDQPNSAPPSANVIRPKRWYRPRNLIVATAVVVGSGMIGAFVSNAVNAQGLGWHGPGMMMGGGMMGRPFGGFARLDPAVIEDRIDRGIRHVAIEIDATTEQQDKLRTIAKAAVKDIVPMRMKVDVLHERGHSLLTAPNVTRGDIEALRTEQMALADAFTKRIAQALGDANEVLNAEQRKKLNELIEARRAMWHRWRHR